ncbi:MAG: hypothetical protein NTW35_03035, partial [Candidatus Nomurabacteria bacterium]|nr:hypothetical protein [Candidatus Nomurabacteria bacterium]
MLIFVRKNLLLIFVLTTVFLSLATNKVYALYLDMDRDFNSNNSFSLLSEISQISNIFTFNKFRAPAVVSYFKNVTQHLPEEISLVKTNDIFVLDDHSLTLQFFKASQKFNKSSISFLSNLGEVASETNLLLSKLVFYNYNQRFVLLNGNPREVSIIGNKLKLFSYKNYKLSSLTSSIFPIKSFSLSETLHPIFANKERGLIYPPLRVANANILPLYALSVKEINNDKGMVLGAFTTAASASVATKNNLPILDRLSLNLYCGLSAFSIKIDSSRCNYDLIASDFIASNNPSTPTAVTPTTPPTESANLKLAVPTPTSQPAQAAPSNSPLQTGNLKLETPPIYITKYITVAGPAGRDGRDGATGASGTPGKDGKDSNQSQGGFGGYVAPVNLYFPTPNQNLIGVSTVSYLRDATLEYSILNYGT